MIGDGRAMLGGADGRKSWTGQRTEGRQGEERGEDEHFEQLAGSCDHQRDRL